MKNNSLIKYKEGFFARLKRKFKSIFIKDNKTNSETEKLGNTNENETIIPESIKNNQAENILEKKSNIKKDEFFELYNKVMNNEIDIKSLELKDIEKIQKILNEDIRINIKILKQKTKILEEKRDMLKKLINE